MIPFNAVPLIIEVLEELGYRNDAHWMATDPPIGFGKYRISKEKFISFRSRKFPYRWCTLKINGESIHVHGFADQNGCSFINLADPRSLDTLRTLISIVGGLDDN
jgi:hypothetical protein